MHTLRVDGRLAELVFLDVVDLTDEGAYVLNAAFREECIATYEAGVELEDVFSARIMARAIERGFAGCVDLDDLALAALEVGAAEADA